MLTKLHKKQVSKLVYEHRVAVSDTDIAIFDFLSALDSPRALTVWLLYSNEEHQQLVDLKVDPLCYNNARRFRDDYTATEFLSKADFLKLAVSKKDAAIAKFLEFEELCGHTNTRFRFPASDPLYKGLNVVLLDATRRKIAEILGQYHPEEFVDDANWGPGVTTKLKGNHVSATNKFHCENGMTQQLYSFVKPWFSMVYPGWSQHLATEFGDGMFSRQEGNVIITVPKNSKTDRVIAVEPGLNLWFQKAIGTMIRKRLLRVGIDLNSQERNQHLAQRASYNNSLATVDFSSASDSISRELVRFLIPERWLTLMEVTRSIVGTYDGQALRWNKFSSMGNGFTFELESLIFFAAASAVQDHLNIDGPISVFGDDVIIPSACYNLFSSYTAFLGFRVNQKKSFSTGYFRESCGAHFYDDVCCKPLFLKEKLQNVQQLYKLANGVRRLAHRRNSYHGCDDRFLSTWRHLLRRVPKSLRFFIPESLGDGGLIGNFDEATPVRARYGIEGYFVSLVVEVGVSQPFEGVGLLLARLKVPSVRQAYKNTYTLRGRTKLRVTSTLVHQWYNLGGWF